jgi:hypothetical protein
MVKMFKNKKGIELSMNVIIIAALSILVLLILIFFLVSSVDNTKKTTGCQANMGNCIPLGNNCPSDKPVLSPFSCPKGEKCCVNMGGLGDETS